ncbi:MAG: hypothetical protein ACR2PQ_13215 [Myxococcota bacterium]
MRRALALCGVALLLSSCAPSQFLGSARRAFRDPGEHLVALPQEIADEYDCATRPLPHFQLERNEVNPVRVRAGAEFNHRMVYALCPTSPTAVVPGSFTTRIVFKGRDLVVDTIPGFEIKPGRWVVDAFVRLPESAEVGVYALEIGFASEVIRFDESVTFGVE